MNEKNIISSYKKFFKNIKEKKLLKNITLSDQKVLYEGEKFSFVNEKQILFNNNIIVINENDFSLLNKYSK